MIKLLPILLALVFANPTRADTWLDIHVTSHHERPTTVQNGEVITLNESNLGLGLSYPMSHNTSLMAGGYRNSYDVNSTYAGVDIHTSDQGARVGVSLVYVTGYEEGDFIALPNLILPISQYLRVKVGFIPLGNKLTTLTLEVPIQ